ncbi:MAG TPA: hypothetical protein ENI34_02870 [candidate division WOR-3 bacterium]|uniref:Uncharacterized protein n=1 Tax=candidate division WOR-3 bacterium TaxID=2052148 RepID=A0A9C9EM26_UNCW3|nr:hypothetical protein [candidate division WOR-3 bacterium]
MGGRERGKWRKGETEKGGNGERCWKGATLEGMHFVHGRKRCWKRERFFVALLLRMTEDKAFRALRALEKGETGKGSGAGRELRWKGCTSCMEGSGAGRKREWD